MNDENVCYWHKSDNSITAQTAFGCKADVARTVEDTPPVRQSSYSIEMSFPV